MSRVSRRQTGSLLIITLWVMTILTVLAVSIGRYLSTDVRIAKYRLARAQAKALARSGVYLAMQRLEQDLQPEADGKTYDWLGDDWAAPPDGDPQRPNTWVVRVAGDEHDASARSAAIEITITDEDRKLNVNSVAAETDTRDAVSRLVNSAELAARIVDAVDADDVVFEMPGGVGVELEPPYQAKNAALNAPEELLDLPGMITPGDASASPWGVLRAFTSVYRGQSKLNLNTVGPEVWGGLGLPAGEQLSACRQQGTVFDESSTMDAKVQTCVGGLDPAQQVRVQSMFGVTSQTFTVISEGIVNLAQGGAERAAVRVRVEAVVRREGCEGGAPTCVVAWREG